MLLDKGMLNFERVLATLPLTHIANPLGMEEKKSASEETVLRKLLSLNRKHFVMEKFYLQPMKQSVFFITN